MQGAGRSRFPAGPPQQPEPAAEKLVGSRRREDVYIRPQRLAEVAGVEREQLARTLRELVRLKAFDYVPPFRGRAVHFTQRDVPFDELNIDFAELDRRKEAEYEKLESVIEFARTPRCRQRNSAACAGSLRCGGPEGGGRWAGSERRA